MNDLKKLKESVENLFNAIKFVEYNKYDDLTEENQEIYGEINSYLLNIGLYFIRRYLPKLLEQEEFKQEIKNLLNN